MWQKQRQVLILLIGLLILLIGLLYVYSVCPLLCATFEQKFCNNALQKVLRADTEIRVTCCQIAKTGTRDEAENPLDGRKTCCSTNLELVFPDDRYDVHKFSESVERFLVLILPMSATSPVAARESLEIPPFLFSSLFADHCLIRRGPPSA